MSTEKDLALVIRAVDYSETSRVVTLFTRDHGRLTALAKGARRLRGPFEAALDLLTLCRVVFIHKSSEGLDLLTEAQLAERFKPLPDLARYYAGFHVAELLNLLTGPVEALPKLFDDAAAALRYFENGTALALAICRFELAVLRHTGHLPRFDRCALCGGKVVLAGRVAFGVANGGLLCASCAKDHGGLNWISDTVVEALRRLSSPSPVKRMQIEPQQMMELRTAIAAYLRFQVGHNLRVLPHLRFDR